VIRFSIVAASFVALNIASAAYAQNAPAQSAPAASQGPLIVERIHNGIVIAPDYKVTEVNGDLGQLAGGYVGRVFDDRLLVGGAGYWLANGSRGTDLGYGGVLIGWTTAPARIRFGARGLVGGGRSTLTLPIDGRVPVGRDLVARFGARSTVPLPGARPSIRVREDFLVLEPQVNAVTKVTSHLAVDVAAGYRLIGMADVLGDRLDGATASLALQLGW
jgi:hypothetical protein